MSDSSPPPGSESKTLELALVRRNPWILAIAALPLMAAIGFLFCGIFLNLEPLIILVPHLLILASALYAMLWIRNPRTLEIEKLVSVDRDGVHLGRKLALARGKIKAGFVVPRPDKRPIVRLEKDGLHPALEIRVDNEDDGREVLRRLGFDATQTIASFVLPSPFFAPTQLRKRFIWALCAALATGGLFIGLVRPEPEVFAGIIILISVVFASTVFLTRTRLRAGADGIVLRSFRNERFIPYAEIAGIEYHLEKDHTPWAGVLLTLRSGENLAIPVSSPNQVGSPRVHLVVNRLQEAFGDHQRGIRASAEARLVRGERDLVNWVRELRRTGSGAAADHRIAPVPADRLLELAEDPHANPVMRANAAVALGGNTENGEFRRRIRVAAQATAAPRLRLALEKAVDLHDETALAEALAEVELEAEKAAQKK